MSVCKREPKKRRGEICLAALGGVKASGELLGEGLLGQALQKKKKAVAFSTSVTAGNSLRTWIIGWCAYMACIMLLGIDYEVVINTVRSGIGKVAIALTEWPHLML